MTDSDNIAVIGIRDGDPKAFDRVCNKYHGRLCFYAANMVGCEVAAKDIVQDFFMILWINRESLYITVSLKLYLYKGVHNHCLKYLEHSKVERRYHERAQQAADTSDDDSSDDPLFMLIAQETEHEIDDAASILPAQCREVFNLVRNKGLSYQEAADRLGISIGTVRKQISLAKIRIANYLKIRYK